MRQLRLDTTPTPRAGKLTFARDTGFHDEVKRRVLAYFERTGLSQQDSPRMHLKTAVLLLWFGASYALLVFAATSVWQGALLSASLALAMAGIGFGIQHDANHGAYSSRAAVNRRDGDDARHAGRELVPLARSSTTSRITPTRTSKARTTTSTSSPSRGCHRRSRATACTTSSSSTCGRCTGSCSRSGTSSTTSRT